MKAARTPGKEKVWAASISPKTKFSLGWRPAKSGFSRQTFSPQRLWTGFVWLLAWGIAVGPTGLLAGPLDNWAYRAKIGINNAGGTETLTDFPLLVSLNASNFDFAKAKPDGTDLRFTTPTGTLLSYEIEKWDPAN